MMIPMVIGAQPCPTCGRCPTCGQYKTMPIPYSQLPQAPSTTWKAESVNIGSYVPYPATDRSL